MSHESSGTVRVDSSQRDAPPSYRSWGSAARLDSGLRVVGIPVGLAIYFETVLRSFEVLPSSNQSTDSVPVLDDLSAPPRSRSVKDDNG